MNKGIYICHTNLILILMRKITIAKGDGIGPEIMDATLKILKAAGAQIETEEIQVGEQVYLSGNTAGIAKESWDVIRIKYF
jgi:isocitrate dehydrogenase